MKIRIPQADRLADLKIAVLESQLEDLYPEVALELAQDQFGSTINITIDFATREDQVHWILSQPHWGTGFEYTVI